MLRSVGEGIAIICRSSCVPEGDHSCEIPESSCSKQDSFSRVHQSSSEFVIGTICERQKGKKDCGKIKFLLCVKGLKINCPLGVQDMFSLDI